MKKISFISMVLCLVMIMSLTVCATSWNTYVSRVEQEKSCWCWAACAEMLAHHEKGYTRDQGDAVEYIKGTASNPRPNVTGTMTDCKNAVLYICENEFSVIKGNALQETALKNKIAAGYPVAAGILWFGGGGHMVVLDKYTDTTSLVRVVDPWFDVTEKVEYEYSDLINGVYLESGYGYWSEYCAHN